ncbi:efflux RND transporter periplasmic adaptor subunit [Aneurinibacillus terranovensis]|uniref:efflux RND transporter periplasmic adaptor subunit n=1 Tax=Aneurinibacillus terranovensis TaxID=278991 RepID=UPI0004045F75|nr:efflux RND transporter periplasmic adaptor subunit [Aneurinibacillus terranovensis]
MRKLFIGITIASLTISSGLLAGCGSKQSAAPVNQTQVIPVEVAQAVEGTLDKGRVLTGTTESYQEVNVVPKASAKVASINVKVGQNVKKGDVLFTLDDTDLRHAVEQSQAAVASAQANLAQVITQRNSGSKTAQVGIDQAMNGLTQADNAINKANNGVAQANNSVIQAQAQLNDAQVNLNRMKQLFDQGAVSKQQVDQAQTAYIQAQTGLKNAQVARQNAVAAVKDAQVGRKNAQAALQNAQIQAGTASSTSGVEASRQQVNQAQVGLQIAQDNLANATVKAPIDGTIGAINGEIGDFASPQSPFMILSNLNPMKVTINAPENMLNLFAPNQSVDVRIPSIDFMVKGRIASISPINQQSKGYPVTFEIPNADGKVKAGMVSQITIVPPTAKKGIIIPTAGILDDNGKTYVYVAQGDKAVRKPITVTGQNSDNSMVTGLTIGDQVIVKGQTLVNTDVKISIQKNR